MALNRGDSAPCRDAAVARNKPGLAAEHAAPTNESAASKEARAHGGEMEGGG